jgi:Flp pilus assembly pilin Flp
VSERSPLIKVFLRDEEGQAATEYILILSVLVTIALLLLRDLVRPLLERLSQSMDERIERMFEPGSMHRSPFRQK